MEPPAVSPDQILDHAPRKARVLRVDANTIAYFGDMFHSFKVALRDSISVGPGNPARRGPGCTASARSPS